MTGQRLLIVPMLLLALLGMAACWHLTTVGAFNDDACYILQARHLLDGVDYGDLWHLPGQAFVLLPAVALFPDSLTAIRVEELCITLAAVVTWWQLGRQFLDPVSAALLGGAFACTPLAWKFGTTAMSDATFAWLVPLLLLLQIRRSPAVILGLGAGLAILCRAPGVLLAAVLIGRDVYRQEWRRVSVVIASLLAVLLVGQACFNLVDRFGVLTQAGSGSLARATLSAYVAAWGPAMAAALGEFVGYPSLWAVAAGLFLAGLASARRIPLLGAFAWLYMALLLGWAFVEPRFLWPVWPLVLLLAAYRRPPRLTMSILGLLVILNVLQLPALYRVDRQYAAIEPRRWASLDWLAQHARGERVVTAGA
ncbi:MAG TPA: hypothetical protein VGO93_17945, partial [Candidatus Xenobia bacterium]